MADTLTIRLGATPSGLTSAYLHHPPIFFTRWMPFLPLLLTHLNICSTIRFYVIEHLHSFTLASFRSRLKSSLFSVVHRTVHCKARVRFACHANFYVLYIDYEPKLHGVTLFSLKPSFKPKLNLNAKSGFKPKLRLTLV